MGIKSKIKKWLIITTPNFIRKYISNSNFEFVNISYSQEGEDLILSRLFENLTTGFFVDIGAHHPKRFSNTYKFYLNDWKGINVDAMPGSMSLFNDIRPKDINLEIAVANEDVVLDYYIFNEPALNSLDPKHVALYNNREGYKVDEIVKLRTKKLSLILDENLPTKTKIDFLSIDVEGLDLEILKSNNWEKYRPKVILIEETFDNIEDLINASDIYQFLHMHNYKLSFRTYNTSLYKTTS